MTFLTPLGWLVALLALLPLASAAFGHRRTGVVRRSLGLPAPERRAELLQPSLAAAGVVLLGLAAAQPALTRTSRPQVRRDAQALFVLPERRPRRYPRVVKIKMSNFPRKRPRRRRIHAK